MKIFLLISGTPVFSIKIKDAPQRQNPTCGDVDIIFDAPKNERINGVFINGLSKHSYSNVRYISWHGFYSFKDNEILNPVINLHHNAPKETTRHRHKGAIKKSDEFAFPIATFMFNGDNIEGFKNYNGRKLELKNRQCIVDVFILPKNLSFQDFIQKRTISIFFLLADMDIYDYSKRCPFVPIDFEKTNFHHEVIDGRTILFRERDLLTLNNLGLIFEQGIYSILHDPNSPLEALVDRGNAYDSDGAVMYNLRERYTKKK